MVFVRYEASWRVEFLAYCETRITNAGPEQQNGKLAMLVWLARKAKWQTVRGRALHHGTYTHDNGRWFQCSRCGAYHREGGVIDNFDYVSPGYTVTNDRGYVHRGVGGQAGPDQDPFQM